MQLVVRRFLCCTTTHTRAGALVVRHTFLLRCTQDEDSPSSPEMSTSLMERQNEADMLHIEIQDSIQRIREVCGRSRVFIPRHRLRVGVCVSREGGGLSRDASEGRGPQRRSTKWLDTRLEDVERFFFGIDSFHLLTRCWFQNGP